MIKKVLKIIGIVILCIGVIALLFIKFWPSLGENVNKEDEKNYKARNSLYKKGIFKFIVILTDYETRENEAYIDFLNDDHTYQFDTNKIHYKKYDQAIKSFKKKGNTYTNKDYQIVVTKNKIKTTYIGTR